MPIYEDERGTYIFNSKDLCMIEHIPALIDAGIDSFKIEGRTKTSLYVATVARTYRKAIDDYLNSPKLYEENLEWYKDEIGKCTTRAFTTGFFFGKATSDSQIYDNNVYVTNYKYIGRVEKIDEKNKVLIEQKNKFSVGDEVELMDRRGINIPLKVNAMYDIDGNAIETAPHSKQMIWIDLGDTKFTKGDILRAKAT